MTLFHVHCYLASLPVSVRVQDRLKVEAQAVVSCHVGTVNPDPPEEQPVLSITETSLQPPMSLSSINGKILLSRSVAYRWHCTHVLKHTKGSHSKVTQEIQAKFLLHSIYYMYEY